MDEFFPGIVVCYILMIMAYGIFLILNYEVRKYVFYRDKRRIKRQREHYQKGYRDGLNAAKILLDTTLFINETIKKRRETNG